MSTVYSATRISCNPGIRQNIDMTELTNSTVATPDDREQAAVLIEFEQRKIICKNSNRYLWDTTLSSTAYPASPTFTDGNSAGSVCGKNLAALKRFMNSWLTLSLGILVSPLESVSQSGYDLHMSLCDFFLVVFQMFFWVLVNFLRLGRIYWFL